MKIRYPVFVVAILTLFGCANPSIVQLSPDTYLLSRNVGGRITGGLASTKAEVFRQANEFAQQQGKIAVPITTSHTPESFSSLGTFEYQFRVVAKNDPEARRASLLPRANIVIENKTEKSSAKVQTPKESKGDLYLELTKLDDLRKRGLLTNKEFEAQKKRLLDSQ